MKNISHDCQVFQKIYSILTIPNSYSRGYSRWNKVSAIKMFSFAKHIPCVDNTTTCTKFMQNKKFLISILCSGNKTMIENK